MSKKALAFIWEYLKDWKNLLSHTIVGILILAVGLVLPIAPIYRLILLALIIVLNVMRMRLTEKKAQSEA